MANWNPNARTKRRGREHLVLCSACGRRIPRDKAICLKKSGLGFLSKDIDLPKDAIVDVGVKTMCYCISCAKHRHIFEKLRRESKRRREI